MADPVTSTCGAKVVENLVERILNFILNPISDVITLVRDRKKNIENLENKVLELKGRKERVEDYIDYVKRTGEVINKELETWPHKAVELIEAADKLVVRGEEVPKMKCFFQLCPNPLPRYKLSKDAKQNIDNIATHVEGSRDFNLPLALPPPLQQGVAAPVEGFEEFRSRKIVLDQIMEALRSSMVNTIGVYGLSGVGKTMLVKEVRRKAAQDSSFAAVVMAKVTKNPDLKSIQDDIARDLAMDQISPQLPPRRVADLIKARLIDMKKFLIILDDVWEPGLDFEQIGIPSASEMMQSSAGDKGGLARDEGKLRKILLTSRDRDVLSSKMGAEKVFEVPKLKIDEAWFLFKKIVGNSSESPAIKSKAEEIVEKCLGLPIAIASVGNALKGETREEEWETARKELGKPTPEGIAADVYKPIEFSYISLRREELKKTFILCSLLGHDSSVDDLLKYGMGLDLFDNVNTMEDGRARVLTWVRRLKLSSLLVDGHSSLHFDMHDQIREVALSVASRDYDVFAAVDANARKKWPEKGTMEKLKWIYMSNADIKLPSNGLQCPQLTFFYLSSQCSAVPPELFKVTEGLQVLCWTKIDFKSMPSPIRFIPESIHSLILDQCVFTVEDLRAIMGNLENLEVLSLAGCDIKELPREIEKLSKLKLLDVSNCTELKVIPRQVLASLSESLEELKMGNSFDQWNVEEGNARLDELAELHKLTALEVCIANFRAISFPENLKRFKIFVGEVWDSWESSFESSKIMKLKLQGARITSNHSIRKLLKNTEELYLEGLNGVESLVDELDDEGFQHLKCLQIQNAPDIRRIFNPTGGLVPSHVFPILEELTLSNLEKMEKICHGLTGATPFKVLRKITIDGCHELKNLFSFSMAGQLQLQEIIVKDCCNIQRVIDDVEEQGNGNDIIEEGEGCTLGTLRSLTLRKLPKLISFNGNCSDISLFNDKVVFPNIEELNFSGIKINQLWVTLSYVENPQGILDFKKLKSLQIYECSSLEYLFTPSMVSSLMQLEDLSVYSCEDLKQVIMVKGIEEVVNTELIFPRLNSIWLYNCSKFSSFYVGSYAIKFKSAIKIDIVGCPNMITFASTFSTEQKKETAYQGTEGRLEKKEPNIPSWTLFHDVVEIPLLDSMHLSNICVQEIWHGQITSMSSFVENLKKLSVWHCDNLKYLFTSSMVESFKQLEVLTISGCEKMQVVILMEESVQKGGMSRKMFPKLDTLELSWLRQLIRFCSNFNSLGEVQKPQELAATQSILVETEITQLVFPQVTCLKLDWLQNFKGFFPQILITKWPLLKRMHVEGCKKVMTFASEFSSIEIKYGDNQFERQTQDPMFWISKDSFPCLEELKFTRNENMEIWRGQYPGAYFPKLKDIELQFRNNSALFPSFFPTLSSLENLVVSKSFFHEIFQCERLSSEEGHANVPSRLSKLKLVKLNDLMHLWKEESDLKSIFYNLRTLEVLECIKLVNLVPSGVSFQNLQDLEISKCHGLKNLVSYSTAKSLEQLKRMCITDCDLVEEIVGCLEDDVKDGIVFRQLKYLQLRGLPRLARFCATKCDLEFPFLKEVIVMGCPQMKYFSMGKTVTKELQNVQWINDEEKGHWVGDLNSTVQDLFTRKVGYLGLENLRLSKFPELIEIWNKNYEEILPFKKLQYLEVCNCNSLSYLLTPSMALSLVQLEDLKIKSCVAMEQVIMVTGVEEVVNKELIFQQLNSISLSDCPNLSSFYVGCYTLKFQSAVKITISNCPNMIAFASTFSTEQEKEIAYRGTEGCLGKKELDIPGRTLFYDAVDIPLLNTLDLDSICVQQIWHSQITSMSSFVQNLTDLTLWNCDNLKYLFTSSMVKSFEQLKWLHIRGSKEMQVVILIEESVQKERMSQTMFPKLYSLHLHNLPRLIRFCCNCNSLGEVYEAQGSEVLVATQSILVETEVTQLVFPQVRRVELNCLPNFKGFFPQIHITKWPLLERMNVEQCDKLKTFALEFSSIELTYGDNQLERQTPDPMFWISKDSFPCLKELKFKQNDNMKEIWRGQYPGVYFPKLKDIKLLQFQKCLALLRSFFFHTLPNLENVVVSESSFHEIFQSDRKSIFYNLRTLKMHECIKLVNLVPLVVSFENLEALEISKCHGLENLVSYSTAKSLEQLKRMSIIDCDLVEEIVKCLEEDVKDGIVFRQLRSLQLRCLPKLSSFCTGKCDFEFPYLEEVIVIGCPQMKYFSLGKTVTKKLQNVQWINDEEKGHWVCDLNSTIQDLFTQKVGYFGFRNLKLTEFSELIEIWKRNPKELALPCKNLQYLEVSNCSKLSYLLIPSMVLSLVQLKDLKVKDCAAMEQVIMVTRVEGVVETDLILFPQLKSILLESCPKLSSFYEKSNTLKFPMLEEITVKDCLKMVRFTSKFSSEQETETADRISEEKLVKEEPNIFIKAFFCDEVEFPNLKLLKLSSININQIWHNQISENPSSIQNLKELVVKGCGTLKYLLTSSMVESFQQLIVLKICGCKMMERVILIEELEEEKRMRQIFFPKLDSLVLQKLPKLTRFCSGNFFEFSSLTNLTISKCSVLKTFISGSVTRSMTASTENGVNAYAPSLFDEKVKFPKLELLNLSSINIHQIWSKNHEEISSFKKLQHLKVCNCSNLSYLVTPSMALGLVQLKDLKVKDCATIEQVIMAVGVEEVVETGLIFPQLNSILLESCSKLSSFYVGSNTLKFPVLKKITVKNCLKRVRFASKFLSDKQEEIADRRSEETHVKEEPDIFIEAFFCDEVEIPILETLTLSSINIKQIWNSQLSSISSFAQYLTKLKVVNCSNLKHLFTFSMGKSFVQLEVLEISGCEMMEVVILIEGMVEEEKIFQTVFPKLYTLVLNDLPQLATFCSNCDSLGEISDSKRVNIGIESQKLLATQLTLAETKATKFVFSQVTCLMLRLLPKFKSFFRQTHITKWPSLKRLVVIECHGAQIVPSEFSSTKMTYGDNQLERESQHLMFWISKATFPSLYHLEVKWNDNMKIWCGCHPEEYFGKLEVLILSDFPKQSTVLLPLFFESLPSLKKLVVKDAFFSEIFQCEEVTGGEKPICGRTPLRKLRLSKLHELKHLWKEESQLEADILNNLTTLKVQECSRLKNLVPSTVYFDKLQTLVVSECHGLVNLVRYPTAQILAQLKRMKVANCEMIEEIVVCLGDAVKDGIVFTKLKCLQLKGLPRLESFCSGICNFKFPALEEVIIMECPNMQTFSKGELSTPKLQEVKLRGDIDEVIDKDLDRDIEKKFDDYFHKVEEEGVADDEDEGVADNEDEGERCWVGNLNSTIHQLFKKKSAHNSKKGNGENSDHDAKEDGN